MTESPPSESLSVQVERAAGTLTLAFSGRLDSSTLPEAWDKVVTPNAKNPPNAITVDAKGLTYCDGAGLGLFAELRRLAAAGGGNLEFRNLSPELERLVTMSLLQDPSAGITVNVGTPTPTN